MTMLYKNDEFMSITPELFTYAKEDIKKMYYEHYTFNLKQLIKSNRLGYSFLYLKDLLLRPYTTQKHWHINTNNKSLNSNVFDKLKLGRNIIENGTYWIYAVVTRPGVDNYVVKYGNHRIVSLKLLQVKKEIPQDYKVFSFICDEKFLVSFASDDENNNINLLEPIRVRLNKEIVQRSVIKNRFQNLQNIEEIDEFTIEADINNMYDLWYSCHAYSLYLRNLLIEHNIAPLEILNNEEEFKRWFKC